MTKQHDLPLLPPAITATISLPNLWALLHTPPTPKSPESKKHSKLLCSLTAALHCSLTAALHGAIYKLTLKSPPTPPSSSSVLLTKCSLSNSSDPQPMFFHCFQGYGHRRVHNQAWKGLRKPLTKTIWKPPLRYSAHSSCVFKRSRP